MKNITTLLIFCFGFTSLMAQQNEDQQHPNFDEEYFENFAEKMMESFDFEKLQEQMSELSEKMEGFNQDFDFNSFEWMDSLNGDMLQDGNFFFLHDLNNSELQEQLGQMQNKLQPMLDSLLNNKGHFQQFNFDGFNGIADNFNMEEMFENMPFDMENFRGFGSSSFTDQLKQELFEDKLFKEGDNNSFEMTSEFLKINGQKQSDETYLKYKELYEETLGHELGKDFSLKLDLGGELPVTKRKTKRI